MKMSLYQNFFKAVLISGVSAMLFTSCLKNDWEECEKKSQDELNRYLSANNISSEYKKQSGLYYIPEIVGTGLSPVANNYIVVNYTGWYLDGTIIETTDSTLKNKWAADTVFKDYIYGPTKFKYGYSRPGFNEGLYYMKEGGWATLIMPTELAFYDCRPVKYRINLISVITDPEKYEDSVMFKFLEDNSIDTTTASYNGIYYKEYETTGDTLAVETNDTISIRYTGKYLYVDNGVIHTKIFDTNIQDADPLKIIFGKKTLLSGSIKAIPDGFTIALDSMRQGTRAIAVLPYAKAFGTTGLYNSKYGYYYVPDYQTVIYDLYVERIGKASSKK
jgi:FKBP-type peptidyl-prolyl cis-trans isomerase FkpA